MSEIYNKEYYQNYDVGNENKIIYNNDNSLREFMKNLAKKIVEDFAPKTLLDAGCAMGLLVEELRNLGVDAYGIDISEYAVSNAVENVHPFLRVCSLTDPLPKDIPQHYDMVTNIEVIEHIDEDSGKQAINNICTYADTILFSSTPDDITDPTHFNVQLPEYWIKQFAKNKFYHKVHYDASYLSSHAILFYKTDNIVNVLENYEHKMRIDKAQNNILKQKELLKQKEFKVILQYTLDNDISDNIELECINNIFDYTATFNSKIKAFNIMIEKNDTISIVSNMSIKSSVGDINATRIKGLNYSEYDFFTEKSLYNLNIYDFDITWLKIQFNVQFIHDYEEIAIMQSLLYNLKNDKIKSSMNQKQFNNYLDDLKAYIPKIINLRREVLNKNKELSDKYKQLIDKDCQIKYLTDYQAKIFNSNSWKITKPIRGISRLVKSGEAKDPVVNNEIVEFENNETFINDITFSIVTPLYNTPLPYLRELIESVQSQTYTKWELCFADGSDSKHILDIEKVCSEYISKDSRIKYKKLNTNEGIAGNTNAAISMSSGNYISLLDHDDLLHPDSLLEVMKTIDSNQADFIYTDEMTFIGDISHPVVHHYKPDFSIDNLRANNYICHFTSFSRSLMDKVGTFNPEFDGSQDHDFIFRLTEQAKNIIHIPKVLYYWRNHPDSVASDLSSKPYTQQASIKAINAHLDRVNISGIAEPAPNAPGLYRIKYNLVDTPKISILIYLLHSPDKISKCVDSIINKTTYSNYEIRVIYDKDMKTVYEDICNKLKDKNVIVSSEDNISSLGHAYNILTTQSNSDTLLFLSDAAEVISEDWIQELLMYSQRSDVGVVGGKLYFPDDTIMNAGSVLNEEKNMGRIHYKYPRAFNGYMGRVAYANNLSVVPGECLMIKKNVLQDAGYYNPYFKTEYVTTDLCIKMRARKLLNIFTPFAELYYHPDDNEFGAVEIFRHDELCQQEKLYMQQGWGHLFTNPDPYYNPNFISNSTGFQLI